MASKKVYQTVVQELPEQTYKISKKRKAVASHLKGGIEEDLMNKDNLEMMYKDSIIGQNPPP
jgi:hypothetical protein